MHKLKSKQYSNFNTAERLNLAIAALARNDQGELENLWISAPYKTYEARDLEYKDRFLAFTLISVQFREICTNLYHKINLCIVTSLLFETKRDIPLLTDLDTAEKVKELNQTIVSCIADLKGAYKGLRDFCAEVNLSVEDFLKTTAVEEKFGSVQEYLALDISANEVFAKTVKDNFMFYWS